MRNRGRSRGGIARPGRARAGRCRSRGQPRSWPRRREWLQTRPKAGSRHSTRTDRQNSRGTAPRAGSNGDPGFEFRYWPKGLPCLSSSAGAFVLPLIWSRTGRPGSSWGCAPGEAWSEGHGALPPVLGWAHRVGASAALMPHTQHASFWKSPNLEPGRRGLFGISLKHRTSRRFQPAKPADLTRDSHQHRARRTTRFCNWIARPRERSNNTPVLDKAAERGKTGCRI